MAQNIFDVTNDQNNEVHVNGFDWSHQCNFTGRLGYVYPFFADLVPAKSSFRVSPQLGLQFMPMVFPVQTRMKARVSFFRMPLRALWKDYKDYVGNFRPNLEEPYLDLVTSFDKFMGTQKLADYLDIPTVLYGKYGKSVVASAASQGEGISTSFMEPVLFDTGADVNELSINSVATPNPNSSVLLALQSSIAAYYYTPLELSGGVIPAGQTIDLHNVSVQHILRLHFDNRDYFDTVKTEFFLVQLNVGDEVVGYTKLGETSYAALGTDSEGYHFYALSSQNVPEIVEGVSIEPTCSSLSVVVAVSDAAGSIDVTHYVNYYESFKGFDLPISFSFSLSAVEYPEGYVEITRDNSPYYDSSSKNKDRQLKLSAYTARTYEAIYNAYLRDNRNNPYYRNGQVEYNVWIPTDEGGADTYPYELHRANWEKDFLTTAVPSPQQGRAPLVGITTYTDSQTVDGITTTALKMALVDENGKRYAVNMKTNKEGVQGVEYAELPEGTSMSPLSYRSLVDAATTGISIPDLRMVNAYQKFLELNMRKGYSYKQIVEGRFDCQVRYDDLNMPEFIGGFTRDVNMNRVVQSVERNATEDYPEGSYANALGSLAGDAFLSADGPAISCFCDEESIIMGIISIVPVPNYSQLLPKYYLYRDLLDHFQPEFNNLGFQPITYKEVCPIQAFNANDDLNAVFGYQRPWYEYVQKTDKVHGLFRTQLRNFLMNRVFDVKPTLTKSFLLVDDEQLNDVFAVTDTTDKIIGQIWLDCSVKLPINRVAIPRLD